MQPEYLARLGESVKQFIHDVEKASGIEIQVALDPNLNVGGATGKGKLAVDIKAQSIRILAPTNGYFPEGAVRHEVLHARRIHIENVPMLVLADNAEWDNNFSSALVALDNAIEHIVIVPEELQFHPERYAHWEAVMRGVCLGLPNVPEHEQQLALCLHWTFLQRVLPNSPSVEIARDFAKSHALSEMAHDFSERFMSAANSKEELVKLLFLTFQEILPKNRAALEYIDNTKCTYQKPIP